MSARGKLEQMERLFRGAEVPAVDYTARLAHLDQEGRNLTSAIKAGGELVVLVDALGGVQWVAPL